MKNNFIKLYAAYKSGCLGDNILDTYFPFFANIIYEQHWDVIEEGKLAKAFADKYGIDLPLTFVRQVLGVGMDNGSIIDEHGEYIALRENMKKCRFDSTDFEKRWEKMRSQFGYFCKKNNIDLSGVKIDESILASLETLDEKIVAGDELDFQETTSLFDYAWRKFLVSIGEKNSDTYDFIASISACNIMKQTIFHTNSATETFCGLNIYLDSPMVFALLGMDVYARTESCKQLIAEALSAGCSVFVFDHNFREIEGILNRAAAWARDPAYSIDKANNVAKFFHDSDMTKQEIVEYCENLEDTLNKLNITVKNTSYDVFSEKFQEDEGKLNSMIEQQYRERGQIISDEKKQSIAIDVRSIVMVYRERKGAVATRIQTAKEIMITLNGTIANVSKKYESNQSRNSGHIPACVSADLFGAVLWLFSPVKFINYQKKQLLADCYIALRPSKMMLEQYVKSLTLARNAGEIDEKKFLFMRSHSVVCDALMNVTKGDYARFNDRTHREVYEEIEEKARQSYNEEVEAHLETQQKWKVADAQYKDQLQHLNEEVSKLKKAKEKDDERRARMRGMIYTLLCAGIPYLVLTVVIEILKLELINNTVAGWSYAGVIFVLTTLLAVFFRKTKSKFYTIAKKQIHNQNQKQQKELIH